jgi:hypothetical protein
MHSRPWQTPKKKRFLIIHFVSVVEQILTFIIIKFKKPRKNLAYQEAGLMSKLASDYKVQLPVAFLAALPFMQHEVREIIILQLISHKSSHQSKIEHSKHINVLNRFLYSLRKLSFLVASLCSWQLFTLKLEML